jgi:hypothetical protein
MKKIAKNILTSIAVVISLSTSVEAKTVLSAKERCFQVGETAIGGWGTVLKIKPQQALTDKPGAVVEVVGLEHGSKPVNPPLNYYNQLAGAASYIASGDQEVTDNITQIALVGTSYGTDTATTEGIHGLWTFDYSLMLEPEKKGRIAGGRLVGVEGFKPLVIGLIPDPSKTTTINQPVIEVSCKGF